jgi:hypothetical protein
MLQHNDVLAAPLHCDGKELMPLTPAAFNTPFGRDYTKDMGACRRSPRSWDAGGAPQRCSAASCADFFPPPQSVGPKSVF